MHTEVIVNYAFWAGVLIVLLTLLIFLQVLYVHAVQAQRGKRSERIRQKWRPLLTQALLEAPESVPRLKRKEIIDFIILWNHLHGTVRGESAERLNHVAHKAGIDTYVVKLIRKSGLRNRLLAIVTIGNLKEKIAWEELKKDIQNPNPVLSLAAARAMVRTAPEETLPIFIEHLAVRDDWAPVRVAGILKDAGADIVSGPLSSAISNAGPEIAPRLIRYLEVAHYSVAKTVVYEMLDKATDEETISACLYILYILKDPGSLDLARRYADHPCWFIRVRVAVLLGRIGTEKDKDILTRFLSDGQWWVRYRAAQALTGLPSITFEEIQELKREHHDRFARDILTQVLSEKARV
jgi:hypothetical protein